MLNSHVRPALSRVVTPLGAALARAGVTPDAVTIVGTVGVAVGALAFYPRGRFLAGTLFITAFVFGDMLDGAVARARGSSGPWGAFLDSTLDRVADAAVFGGLLLWFAGVGNSPVLAGVTLFCLVGGAVVSYAKARAEGLGMHCDVGVAERSERLIIVLVATGLGGLGVPYVQAAQSGGHQHDDQTLRALSHANVTVHPEALGAGLGVGDAGPAHQAEQRHPGQHRGVADTGEPQQQAAKNCGVRDPVQGGVEEGAPRPGAATSPGDRTVEH